MVALTIKDDVGSSQGAFPENLMKIECSAKLQFPSMFGNVLNTSGQHFGLGQS